MPERTATAVWEGSVPEGHGKISLGSGLWRAAYTFSSRFQSSHGSHGTNPEELLGAAHAGCFSMALALGLAQSGHPPTRITTSAKVALAKTGDGYRIPRIDLTSEGEVPGIDQETFSREATKAKLGCPVSKALSGVEIVLEAKLVG